MLYNPPYTITPAILKQVAGISETIGRLSMQVEMNNALRLRRANRIRTVQGSLAIEGNTLNEGKRPTPPSKKFFPPLLSSLFFHEESTWHYRTNRNITSKPGKPAD